MKVSIIGGTGFVGAYLVDELLRRGHHPRLLVRAGSEDKVPARDRCDVITGDLASHAALAECMTGADAMIYLVGILREFPRRGITFDGSQRQGFVDALEAARQAGVARVVLMSANGVEHEAVPYQVSKRAAERALAASDRQWTVFRPSVIFGDPRGRMEFCTQLKGQLVDPPLPAAVFFPGLALHRAGGQPMSPVHVGDVARAFAACLDDPGSIGRTYPLGGPREITWKDIIGVIARASGRSGKATLPAPAAGVRAVARLFEGFAWFPLTADQVTLLMQGNACDGSEAFARFGITPTRFDEQALAYLRGDAGRTG